VLALECALFLLNFVAYFEVFGMQLEAECSILVLTPQCFARQVLIYEIVLKDL
jgi:hypothetical protein